MDEQEPTRITCPTCEGFGVNRNSQGKCTKCAGTGAVFWVSGYTFPYTPEDEARAKKALKKALTS
jgi:DnaJ-class molecular chaperone